MLPRYDRTLYKRNIPMCYLGNVLYQTIYHCMSLFLHRFTKVQDKNLPRLRVFTSKPTWWSVRGSETTRRRGSLKAAWIWLVNVPGVKRPAMGLAPVLLANFRIARYIYMREE